MATLPPPMFTVRVRDTAKTQRILLPNGEKSTWKDFQQKVQEAFGTPVATQRISKTQPHEPKFVQATPSASLSSLSIGHGDMLYLIGNAPGSASPAAAGPSMKPSTSFALSPSSTASSNVSEEDTRIHKITPRCQHGPRGRCIHCDGIAPGSTPKFSNACNHGPHTICIHCSKHVQDKNAAEPAEWLCNHPPTVFCPKCIPPSTEKKNADGPAIKIDKIPFKRFMESRQALCKYRHNSSTTCAMCAAPQQPSFLGKSSCERGHRPWPHGVCPNCAPPNAVLRPQEYRHCDGVSLPANMLKEFYDRWTRENKRQTMRAAILYGSYIDEPAESKNPGAIRSIVAAMYEPKQENLKSSVRLLNDPDESLVNDVAHAMGLQPVGWVLTSLERPGGAKYGGKVLMSGLEVCTAAALQEKYKNKSGHSRFVTVILEHGAQVEPLAYQVSDQCQALVRDGVIESSLTDPMMLQTRKLAVGEMAPTIVYHDHPLENGAEFMPDNFLVKVIVMTSAPQHYLFKHHDAPPPRIADKEFIKHFLSTRSDESLEEKLSDFSLLCSLAKVLDTKLVLVVADQIAAKQKFSDKLCDQLDRALLECGLIDLGS